jgi:hypothetical protein
MSHNWFLQLEGHDWIELHSFDVTTGKPAFSVSVALTAPALSTLGTCSNGRVFSRAAVALRAQGLPGTYLQYNFTNLSVTGSQLTGLSGTPMKTIWFAFGRAQISYVSPANIVGWDEALFLQFHLTGSLYTALPVAFGVRGK